VTTGQEIDTRVFPELGALKAREVMLEFGMPNSLYSLGRAHRSGAAEGDRSGDHRHQLSEDKGAPLVVCRPVRARAMLSGPLVAHLSAKDSG
jgi:hypothetical protein